jgi:DNA-binding CsgD family transcriptional regulator
VANRLYERSAEIAAIDAAVARLAEGRGSSLLFEARAGRGKSTLLEYAVEQGAAAGARALTVRSRHLASAAPFEVLRRLLGPAVEEAGGPEALTGAARFAAPLFTPGADLSQGIDYGCLWLIAWLADQSPLVLAVDDAQWADTASIRVLLDVQAELEVHPVALVLASRPVENPEVQRLLATMAAHPECSVLTPARLSREAVAGVASEVLGHPVEEEFVDECLKVSGGNAFYLQELLRPLKGDEHEQALAPGSASLRRTVSWRLGELGQEATQLAQAAAVLGDGCALHGAAELAGLDEPIAVREAARLEAASILRQGDPMEFLHPLVRAAVEADLPKVVAGELHARAGRMLWESGESPGPVAQHLLAAPGAGDPRVTELLADQGQVALAAGSYALAKRLLVRALDEPAPADRHDSLLVALARAEHALHELDDAQAHLEEAMESTDRLVAVEAAVVMFEVLFSANRYAELGNLYRRALGLRPYGDSRVEVQLRAELVYVVVMAVDPEIRDLPAELALTDATSLSVDRDVDRYLLVMAAIHERTLQHGTTERLDANLTRAVASIPEDPAALGEYDLRVALGAATFLAGEDSSAAEAILDRVAPAAARLAGVFPEIQADLDHRRIVYALYRGDFEDALSRLDLAEELTARHGLTAFDGHHRFVRGRIALERGAYAEAGQLLADPIGEDTVYPALGALLAGHAAQAVAILETLDLSRDPEAAARPIEVELQPHLIATHAYELRGDRRTAVAEADRELALRRRYGPPSALALALRRRASFMPSREALGLLEEALAVTDGTTRRPVLARVLLSYGAALRRSDRLQDAREPLYRAADLATEMGMERVRENAYRELSLAGARPRRARATGPASMTDAQQQVASLAAQGLTNREIAERLFVTIKTVETHLMAVYRKLGIRTRDELAAVLTPAGS